MVDTDQRAVEEAVQEGESMRTEDLVHILEQYHDDRPGVPLAAVEAYTRELAARGDTSFDPGTFRDIVEDRLTDADEWVDEQRLYELGDDRLSQYPEPWHDALHGETDPAAYLRFLEESAPSFLTEQRGDRLGLKQDRLAGVMKAIGGLDRQTAAAAIERARDDGRVVEDADQHPRAGVYLPA
jgi:hypothetical protein